MKKLILFIGILAMPVFASAQKIALKNNLVWDATLSPNLALEVGLSKRTTLDIYGAVNPFNFDAGKRFKHWIAQPEFRWWTCESFNGSFFGLHALGGSFLFNKLDVPFGLLDGLKDHRYEGYFYGAGISYGYQWILSRRWNFEATVGIGYARFVYDVYDCDYCAPTKLYSNQKNYFGPTKLGLSFVYLFK